MFYDFKMALKDIFNRPNLMLNILRNLRGIKYLFQESQKIQSTLLLHFIIRVQIFPLLRNYDKKRKIIDLSAIVGGWIKKKNTGYLYPWPPVCSLPPS